VARGNHNSSNQGGQRPAQTPIVQMTTRQKWVHTLKVFVLLFVLFIGGMELGLLLAEWLAPGSWLAKAAGMFMLPLSLGLGMTAWYTIATTVILSKLAMKFARRPDADFRAAAVDTLRETVRKVPPGAFIFLPISLGVCFVAGVLMGLSPHARSLLLSVAVCTLLGAAYGATCWLLARGGHLPIPEEA